MGNKLTDNQIEALILWAEATVSGSSNPDDFRARMVLQLIEDYTTIRAEGGEREAMQKEIDHLKKAQEKLLEELGQRHVEIARLKSTTPGVLSPEVEHVLRSTRQGMKRLLKMLPKPYTPTIGDDD